MAGPADTRATSPDWTAQAAGTIESVVGTIRDKTTVPVTTIARGAVYGLLAAVVGTAALTLLAVGLVRGLVILFGDRAWAAHLVTGGIFTLAGLFLWGKRTAKR